VIRRLDERLSIFIRDKPSFSSKWRLQKHYYLKGSVEKWKVSGHESQGACRQYELIGVKPPVTSDSDSGSKSDRSAWGYNRATLFLGDINTGTWPSRLGEYPIWDSKIQSWVSPDSDLRMTALARTRGNCKRQTHPVVREDVHKDNDYKYSVGKILLVVILNWLVAKTNWLVINRQS
jgi:hypothetical protein